MQINADFSDLLKIFNAYGVRYLLVGGYAVMYYAEPRFTKDIDIWVEPTPENAKNVWDALEEFGVPLQQVTLDDFCDQDLIYQIGVAPNRIDILMDVQGVVFTDAWNRRVQASYGEVPIGIIHLDDLITAKENAGREQDLLDLKQLKTMRNRQ